MNRIPKPLLFSLFSSFLFIYSPVFSDDAEPARTEWKLSESYSGTHSREYDELRWKIPNLIRQTEINVAVRTGLNFQDGWQYPLTIGFVDGSPMGIENILAYVQIYGNGVQFEQVLNINLDAYAKEGFNFEKVFAHELTHAMMNDSIGGQAALMLPVWFHEGLAVFAADQGEALAENYAHRTFGFSESQLLNGLEGSHGGLDYAEDYLALQYIWEDKGQNAFRNFVGEVIRRKGDLPGASQYTCNVSWDDFQKNARTFAAQKIKSYGPPRRGEDSRPY